MAEWKVIHRFRDLQDVNKTFPNGREYGVGDSFPATRRKVLPERLEELSGVNNKIKRPLITRGDDE